MRISLSSPLALCSILFAVAAGLFLSAGSAQAALVYWDGGGSSNDWTEAANWSGNVVPGSGDDVIFNSFSTKDAVINTTITAQSLTITSSYTGDIETQGYDVNVMNSMSIANGTFDSTSSDITVEGQFTISGGTFTAPGSGATLELQDDFTKTGGVFTPAGGLVSFVYGSADATWDFNSPIWFEDLRIELPYVTNHLNFGDSNSVYVLGDLTLSGAGGIYADADYPVYFSLHGDVYQEADFGRFSFIPGVVSVVFDFIDNSVAQTYELEDGASAPIVVLNNTADQTDVIILPNSNGITNFGGLVLDSGFTGTLVFYNTYPRSVSIGSLEIGSSGSIDASGDSIWYIGDFVNDGSFTAPETVAVSGYAGSSVSWDVGSLTVNKLWFNTDVTFTSSTQITALDDVTFNNAAISGNLTFYATADVNIDDTFDGGDVPLWFTGTGTQHVTFYGSPTYAEYTGDIYVNKSSGRVILDDQLIMSATGQDLTIQEGGFFLNGNDLTVNGTGSDVFVEDGGRLTLQGNETVTLNAGQPTMSSGGVVRFVGDNDAAIDTYTITSPFLSLGAGQLGIASTDGLDKFQLGGNLSAWDVNVFDGVLDVSTSNYSITFQNEFTVDGEFTPRSGTVIAGGSDAAVIDVVSGTKFNNFTMNDPGGSLTFATAGSVKFVGLVTLQGSGASDLVVRGLSSSYTNIDFAGTEDWDYLDIADIHNTNASAVTCVNCTDSGDNTNITF